MVQNRQKYCPDCKTNENEIVKPGEMLKKEKENIIPEEINNITNSFGSISGIDVGTFWKTKQEMLASGVHKSSASNICSDEEGVYSLILDGDSSIYQDTGKEFYYNLYDSRIINVGLCLEKAPDFIRHFTKNCNKNSSKDDCFGVAQNWNLGKPVRVIRGANQRNFFKFSPKIGYRYDGLYKVVEYFPEIENGQNVWRFYLRRDDDVPPPWTVFGHNEDLDVKIKKRAIEVSENRLMKLISKDDANSKIWNVLKESAKPGSWEFVNKVKEVFTCVCCDELVKTPITTTCKHNICYECLKKCFFSGIYDCPYCRFNLENKCLYDINYDLKKVLDMLFK